MLMVSRLKHILLIPQHLLLQHQPLQMPLPLLQRRKLRLPRRRKSPTRIWAWISLVRFPVSIGNWKLHMKLSRRQFSCTIHVTSPFIHVASHNSSLSFTFDSRGLPLQVNITTLSSPINIESFNLVLREKFFRQLWEYLYNVFPSDTKIFHWNGDTFMWNSIETTDARKLRLIGIHSATVTSSCESLLLNTELYRETPLNEIIND